MPSPPPAATLPLLEASVLPGEERSLATPQVEPGAIAKLVAGAPAEVVVVSIASPTEVPSLLAGRWATACTWEAKEGGILVRGLRRVKLLAARGHELLEGRIEEIDGEPRGVRELATATSELLRAVSLSPPVDASSLDVAVHTASSALLRALTPSEGLPSLLEKPLYEAVVAASARVQKEATASAAARELEAMVRATAPEALSALVRHRLWSQAVDVMRRLDIYDPDVPPSEDELARLQRQLSQAGLPKHAREVARRELRLLRPMDKNHHDYSNYVRHLDLMTRLAWHPTELPPIALDRLETALDTAHAGLAKPKKRILEAMAVRKLGGGGKALVLCLAGPPGVGKTTLARAIAEALGRAFVRVPLGGVHEESELRGHRMTFQAAAPGRIIDGLARTGTQTAVVLLDEIDKVGADRQRSPIGALLEALDPEQNKEFTDNYLAVPYDLSHVLWIATANDTDHIPHALRDRLEIVELEGYSSDEKLAIARRHLLHAAAKDCGLPEALAPGDAVLAALIEEYTRESGVRELTRVIGSLSRARALDLARGGASRPAVVDLDEVHVVLGPPRHARTLALDVLPPGVATALSVSAGTGALLYVEVALVPGRARLVLTGRQGEVMREAAQAALSLLLAEPDVYGVDPARLRGGVHVHFPDAASPKDGPSAGCATLLAMISAARGTPIPADVALTGELTLTGRVLPVGGVKEKVLAAERAGRKRVLIPLENLADAPALTTLSILPIHHARELVRDVFAEAGLSRR